LKELIMAKKKVETTEPAQLSAQEMLKEMIAASSAAAVAKATGIAYPTIMKISKEGGKTREATEDKIRSIYDGWKAGNVELAAGRAKRTAGASKAKAAPGIDRKALEAELVSLERKAEAIKSLLKLY
jgi:hypothetical protein